jgi:hypothetical protein
MSLNNKMKNLVPYWITMLMTTTNGYSQFPDTAWIYNFGSNGKDFSCEIIQTKDSGYFIIGTTNSFCNGATDIYALKLDSNFNYKWSRAYGGNNVEWGYSVQQTFDGGYIVSGFTNSFGAGGYDVYLIKLKTNGDTLWTKVYGGANWDFGYSVKQTKDSGYIICGETYSYGNGMADIYIIRTNKNGDTIWTRTFGGANNDIGQKVVIYKDTIYMIVGETTSFGAGNRDLYLLSVNQSGNLLFSKTYGSTKNDYGTNLDVTNDNGFVMIGASDSINAGDLDFYTIRTDSLGNSIWQQFTGNTLSDIGRDVIELGNGNFVLCGTCDGCGTFGKGLLMQLLNSGGWWLSGPAFGGPMDEEGYSVIETFSNELVFAGTTTSYGQGFEDIYIVYLDTNNIVMNYNLVITNYADTTCPLGFQQTDTQPEHVNIYPNPFQGQTVAHISPQLLSKGELKMEIMDCLGNKVQIAANIDDTQVIINGSNLAPGVYFYHLTNNKSFSYSGKLIIY